MKTLVLSLGLVLAGCAPRVPERGVEMNSRVMGMREGASGGWQVNGKLIPRSPFAGSAIVPTLGQEGVSLQAAFKESREHTIQLDIDNSADDNASAHFIRAVANITWNVEGGFVTRRVSCTPGMSVTGVAQAVRIVIQDASVVPVGQVMRPYIVSALVAPGSRPSVQQPPFLEGDRTLVANNGTVTLPAPIGVGAISLYLSLSPNALGTALAAGQYNAEMRGNTGFALKSWDPIQQQGWIPLAPGTVAVVISATGAGPITFVVPTWGIDG